MRAVWGGRRARASVFSLGITSSRKHALQRNAKWNFSHSCCFRCSLLDRGAHKCLWNVHTWVENPFFSGVESIPCFVDVGSRTKVTLWHVRLNLRHLKGNSIRLLAHGCTPPSTSHAFFFFAGCKFCFAFCVATEGHLLAFVISRPKASFFFFFFPSVSGWVATNQRLGAVYACYKMLCAGSRNGCSFSPFLTPHFPLSFL